MKNILLLVFTIALFYPLKAQLITSTPTLPTDADEVTIVFDATAGSAGLAGYTGDVYAHAGVITNLSTHGGDWKYVIADWNVNTTKAKMTSLGNDKYQLILSPSVREFYGVAAVDTIQKLAFVFRNADGSKTGKTTTGEDIFVDVYEAGLAVSITSPDIQPYFTDASANFDIHVEGTDATSVLVKVDGNTVHTETVSPNSFNYTITAAASGTHEIVVEATDGSTTTTDNFVYVTRSTTVVEALPANVKDGINYIDDNTVTLVLHAPYKNSVYAFGSFNNWQPIPMKKTVSDVNDPELRYWISLTGLMAGKEYIFQYIIDEELKIADPYTEKISDPLNDKDISNETYPDLIGYPSDKTDGIAATFQTAQTPYNWQLTSFTPPKKEDLVIYELLIRDFAAKANYQTLIDTIGYFKRLGINAIELMPTNEFEGNDSWGYNPSFYFAPDKAYGTKNKMKEFIDVCHQNGIAVFIDLVLNHSYGQSPFVQMYFDKATGQPSAQNPWYNQTSPNQTFSWGYDFNHESNYTKALVDSVNRFWLSEYKVDGFRFDFTKGFTNTPGDGGTYDQARINILNRMYDAIKVTKPDAYVIFEHLADNTEEKVLANYGIMLWGKMTEKYTDGAMGYNDSDRSNLSWGSYEERGWSNPNLVSYMESHDEQRMMYNIQQNGNATNYYDTKLKSTALARVEMAACFFFTIPGPKMIWQFGELGYDFSIDYNGRVGKKPVKWEYYDENDRYRLYQVFGALIKLKQEQDVFETDTFTMDVAGPAKRINLKGPNMDVTVIGNFDVLSQHVDPNFQQTGTWYDYFSGESIEVTNVNEAITLAPGEYHIYTTVQLATPDIIADVAKIEKDMGVVVGLKTYPNPATEAVKIEFTLKSQVENADVSIFNMNGQKMNTLYSGKLLKGQHNYEWQLNNPQGSKVSKGLYLLKIGSDILNKSSVLIVE